MTGPVQFRILGPLEASTGARPLKLGARKQRGLLALLLLRANQPVSTDTLIDGLWGETPPESAPNALQVYVSGLRKLLGPDVLLTKPPGYELRIDPAQLDLTQFEDGIEQGRRLLAAGDADPGAERLAQALELWRGRPLAELELGTLAEAEAARLNEVRLSAIEDRIEAELSLGRHARLIAELEALVAEEPLRERLHAQLALALYRTGRQADALDVCRSLRRHLAEELGLEPSPALRDLERGILGQDPALDLDDSRPVVLTATARKPITVLLVELAPATPIDPEAEQMLGSRLARELSAIPQAHGAAVERGGGARLIAIFGLPFTHEDDALRAARAALELQERASVRIAIASGEAIVSEGATPAEVGGSIVREAERLCLAAAPSETLLGERSRTLLGEAAEIEPAGDAWRLLGLGRAAEAIPRRLDAPLVGRRRELAKLGAGLDEAIAGRTCRLVVLVGPAGIGKSRLVHELAAQREADTASVAGRCPSYGEGISLLPLGEIVRQLAGDDIRGGLAKLLRGERLTSLVVDRLTPALGAGAGEMSPEQTFWAARRLFEIVARRRPLLVCIEDAHWAEPALLDLVDYLVEWVRDAPVLVIVTGRPELLDVRPEWGASTPHGEPLRLEPLSKREVDALLRNLLGRSRVDEPLRSRIAQAAGGNPLFVEQVVAMLGDDPAGAARLSVPPTIQALLAARLDLLGREERVVVERGAVVGREFGLDLLVELVPDLERDEVLTALESLQHKQFIEPGTNGSFRFRHDLIADVAYETIPKLLRADLHERLADRLEAHSGLPEHEDAIGHHVERAYRYREELDPLSDSLEPLGRRAAALLTAGGLRSSSRGDMTAAVSLLSRAAALPRGDDAASAELLLALAGALRETSDLAGAQASVAEAADLAERIGRRDLAGEARVLRLRLQIMMEPEFAAESLLATATEAIRELEELGDERGLGEAWLIVAWARWLGCQAAQAEEALLRAVAHARTAADARGLAQAMILFIGAGLFGPLSVSDAMHRCEDVLVEQPVPLRIEAAAHRALGALAAMQSRFDEGRAHLDRDLELIEEGGLRIAFAAAAEIWGYVEMLAGNPAAGEAWLRRGLDRLPAEETTASATLLARLAEAVYRQGRYDDALRLTEACEKAAAADDLSVQVQWRAVRGKVLAAQGAVDERLATDAVALSSPTDFMLLQGEALVDAAEVMRLCDRPEEAAPLLDRAVTYFERKGNIVSAADARERRAVVVTRRPVRRKA